MKTRLSRRPTRAMTLMEVMMVLGVLMLLATNRLTMPEL